MTLPSGEEITVTSGKMFDVLDELQDAVFPNGLPPGYARLSNDDDVARLVTEKMEETGSDRVIGTFGAGHSSINTLALIALIYAAQNTVL